MSRNAVIYVFPFALDIAVALLLFVGRHSLASRGLGPEVVGSILLCFGGGYLVASLFMRRIVRPRLARMQMLGALGALAAICALLPRVESVWLTQVAFCAVPFSTSLFFNAFQAYMLGVAHDTAKPLAAMAGHYTFAWSLGYALGPFASGWARSWCDWAQIYYLAAAIAVLVGVLVLWFRPASREEARSGPAPAPPPSSSSRGSLVVPSWIGVALAWIGWNAVSTWWPVQAATLGYSAAVKGAVEFAFALSQSLGALALVYAGAWHHRPALLPGFGLAGVLGLVVLASAGSPAVFGVGAVLYGLYTSSAFSLMVYHSMLDPERAVARVAVNETVVGFSFLAGPVVAGLVVGPGGVVEAGYGRLALLLLLGIAVQTWSARSMARGHRPEGVE
ncbi:MAG: MFS transporter [Candidatus Latescibacterota bacterium]